MTNFRQILSHSCHYRYYRNSFQLSIDRRRLQKSQRAIFLYLEKRLVEVTFEENVTKSQNLHTKEVGHRDYSSTVDFANVSLSFIRKVTLVNGREALVQWLGDNQEKTHDSEVVNSNPCTEYQKDKFHISSKQNIISLMEICLK